MLYFAFPLVGGESHLQEFVSQKRKISNIYKVCAFLYIYSILQRLKTVKNKNKLELLRALPAPKPIRWFPMDEKACGRMLSPISSLLQAQLTCQLIYETSPVSSFRINHFLPSAPFTFSPFIMAFNFSASSLSSLRLFVLDGHEILGKYFNLIHFHIQDPIRG